MADIGIFTEDDRVELIDGEIIEMAPIGSAHAAHVRRLERLFHDRIDPEEAAISVQNPIHLGEHSEPQPDLALLEPRDDDYLRAHPSADDVLLVVEVADTSLEADREQKIPLYASHDIPAVWLLDLRDSRLEVFDQPSDGEYRRIQRPAADQSLDVPGLDDLQLTPGDILL